MKVFEILQAQPVAVTEETLINKLKSFDWNYEFSDDLGRQRRGHQAMNVLESQVYEFWKKNPERALELWIEHSPFKTKGITPSFILRLEAREG